MAAVRAPSARPVVTPVFEYVVLTAARPAEVGYSAQNLLQELRRRQLRDGEAVPLKSGVVKPTTAVT